MSLSDLLFDVPWWLPATIAVIGIALAVQGNTRQAWGVRKLGAWIIGIALVWTLMSWLIDTDKEKAAKGTRQLIQAVVKDDWTTFRSLLTPSAFIGANGYSAEHGADAVTSYARAQAVKIRLKSATVRSLATEQTGPLISTRCEIFTTEDALYPSSTTSWQFDWERTSEGWKVREIRLLALPGIASSELDRVIPRAR